MYWLTKRLFDFYCSLFGMAVLLPIFAVVAIFIKAESKGPVFFRQVRVGKNGQTFRIFKFRSMYLRDNSSDRQVTAADDSRITRTGKWIRQYKIDELPQLLNVLLGDMSLVGPRPEVPRYVAYYSAEMKIIALSVLPGITDIASIEYRDENELLSEANDPEQCYLSEVLPRKLGYVREYVERRSFFLDLQIILKTLRCILR